MKPLDALVNRYRRLSGNKPIYKNEAARMMLRILKGAGTVGILADQNTMPDEGVFVDFFGIPACTASGMARVALHTGAAVVPAFTIWDSVLRKYRVEFDPALDLVRTGDNEADALANTALFTKVIEQYVRRYPDQWLWVHRRWKTRPPEEPPLY
jgi:KDO2-lipid IV(A) lauroyltransferase